MKQRAQFATKIGVIATTVGSAVGLGNIWRFPYEAGTHGGGAFLMVYLACVFIIGVPVLCAEFVMGRGTHKNVRGAFKQLHSSRLWHFCSYTGILASLMIISFYSVVAGWVLEYFFQAISGTLTDPTAVSHASTRFSAFCSSTFRPVMWTVLFLAINHLIVSRGVQKGIERVSNTLMPMLAFILVALCINGVLLPGAAEGLTFFFLPDFSQITPSVILGAMGQAFFSLSLGLSCMLIYSSYFSDDVRLVRSATTIALLDTLVAVLAGVIVFSAVFSYSVQPEQGPKLVFEVFPSIFAEMPGGYVWAVLFFLLLFFASITSTISMSEISIAFFSEEYSMSRNKAAVISTTIAVVFGIICALSFGVLSDLTIFGMTVFSLFDFVSSNILLPVGGVMFSIFVGWFLDRTFLRNQLTNNGSVKVYTFKIIVFLMRFIAPTAIITIFIYGLI